MKTIIKPAGKKGRGVFANQNFNSGRLVIRNPVLPLKKEDIYGAVTGSILHNYPFYLCGKYLLCLGEGCLINHDDNANLWYTFNKKEKTIDFFAGRTIKKGMELSIDYGWEKYPWE